MNPTKDPAHAAHMANHLALAYKEPAKSDDCLMRGWGFPVLGVTLVSIAVFLFLLNPVYHIISYVRTFDSDSFMFGQWLDPPIKVNLDFHVFNYTNTEAFLRGEEPLRVQELGPYSFQEFRSASNISFNGNNTVTYVPTMGIADDPAGTVGNLLEDVIVVPNIIFLGLSSYLAESSFFTNMAFNVFSKMVKSEPFLTMTVDQYLRGYDEPLLSYARKIIPGMIPIKRMGFIDAIVFDGENIVTMNVNGLRAAREDGSVVEPFSVDTYNGSPGLEQWGFDPLDNTTHKPCNTLSGVATEGVLVPRMMTNDSRINYYRKAFCRTMQIVVDRKTWTSKGVPAYLVKFTDDNFHSSSPANTCYCREEACLPDGITDISPCFFGMPLAISSPHFLFGKPALESSVQGLEPTFEKHKSFGVLDETFGIIVHAKLRIQLNLVMKPNRFNAITKPFSNLVLPAMWAEYHFNELPDTLHIVLYFCVVVLPKLMYAFEALLGFVGVVLLFRGFVGSPSPKAVYRRLFLYRRPTHMAELHTIKTHHTVS